MRNRLAIARSELIAPLGKSRKWRARAPRISRSSQSCGWRIAPWVTSLLWPTEPAGEPRNVTWSACRKTAVLESQHWSASLPKRFEAGFQGTVRHPGQLALLQGNDRAEQFEGFTLRRICRSEVLGGAESGAGNRARSGRRRAKDQRKSRLVREADAPNLPPRENAGVHGLRPWESRQRSSA